MFNIFVKTFVKVIINKKLDYGNATLVVAVPDEWIDVQTLADLEEISFDFKDKKKSRLRVATTDNNPAYR